MASRGEGCFAPPSGGGEFVFFLNLITFSYRPHDSSVYEGSTPGGVAGGDKYNRNDERHNPIYLIALIEHIAVGTCFFS